MFAIKCFTKCSLILKTRSQIYTYFFVAFTLFGLFALPSCGQAESAASYYPLRGIKEKKFLQTVKSSRGESRSILTFRWLPEEQYDGTLTIPIQGYKNDQFFVTYYQYERNGSVYYAGFKNYRKKTFNVNDPHTLQLKKGFTVGDKWKQVYTTEVKTESGEFIESNIAEFEISVVGKEDVTVTAGTFPSCYRMEIQSKHQKHGDLSTTAFRCKEVGLVKYIETSSRYGMVTIWELISYQKNSS